MRYIYVAGPYTKPDPCVNTHKAIQVGNELIELGFVPFVPHLTHLWHTITPRSYHYWLDYDREWLKKCDALLRLPGESAGAVTEVALARELCLPVFLSIDELLTRAREQGWLFDQKTRRIV